MLSTLLHTKLQPPVIRATLVARPRLHKTLNQALNRKLTILSASAGFGKTTLVIHWLGTINQPIAWLSLSEEENDITRFLNYFTAALHTAHPNLGDDLQEKIQPSQPSAILTLLLNQIALSAEKIVCILDDYHLITDGTIHEAMRFCVEHMPTNMHLILLTRETPNLPLSRLRGQNQLLELREADLRLTREESANFLNQVMGLSLSLDDIAALEHRTEGWVTGLQLAAISMQGQGDPHAFIASFTGNHHYIFDYLMEEVWQQQPQAIQTFLLHTAVLKRLSGPLCDALLADSAVNGQTTLERLEQANLLLVPLDNERQWYRYHHLFADMLLARLKSEQPELIPHLHLRATEWYTSQKLYPDAIHHTLAAKAFTQAADLIEQTWPILRQHYHESTLRSWVQHLPDNIIHAHPLLAIFYTLALLPIDTPTAEVYLEQIEARIAHGQTDLLSGLAAFARAYEAAAKQQTRAIIEHAQRALTHLPDHEHLYRGAAAALLGLAQWSIGQLSAAQQSIAASLPDMQKANNLSAIIGTRYLLADIQLHQGQYNRARDTIQHALQLASQSQRVPQGTADLHVLLSELHYERNELETAVDHLLTAQNLGEHAALQEPQHRWFVMMARIKAAQGDTAAALDLLTEAAEWQTASPTPNAQPIEAHQARVWIQQGDVAKATAWATNQALSIHDEPTYLREFEHLTLIKLHLAQYQTGVLSHSLNDIALFLQRLQATAETQQRTASLIEIFILQATLHHLHQDQLQAINKLKRALQLGKQEQNICVIIHHGTSILSLLQEISVQQVAPDYVDYLLEAANLPTNKSSPSPAYDAILIDPLSGREIEILEAIAQGLTNQQIADRFYLSLYTVKAHARNIYSKLDVNTRTQAVNRARTLKLLRHS